MKGSKPRNSYGTAGGGLIDAKWAANAGVAEAGRLGEVRTGEILDKLAKPGGPTVLHDLTIPIPGFTANIDHVVVSKRTVLLIDTKVWKPGFVWTLRGHTRRGLSRFPYPDKKTMLMARESVGRLLNNSHTQAKFAQPVLAVWSSRSSSDPTLTWCRPAGAKAIHGDALARYVKRKAGTKPADPKIIAVLQRLVVADQDPDPFGVN